jgi:hypothetical protein
VGDERRARIRRAGQIVGHDHCNRHATASMGVKNASDSEH